MINPQFAFVISVIGLILTAAGLLFAVINYVYPAGIFTTLGLLMLGLGVAGLVAK